VHLPTFGGDIKAVRREFIFLQVQAVLFPSNVVHRVLPLALLPIHRQRRLSTATACALKSAEESSGPEIPASNNKVLVRTVRDIMWRPHIRMLAIPISSKAAATPSQRPEPDPLQPGYLMQL
jgi:hypothetical protein